MTNPVNIKVIRYNCNRPTLSIRASTPSLSPLTVSCDTLGRNSPLIAAEMVNTIASNVIPNAKMEISALLEKIPNTVGIKVRRIHGIFDSVCFNILL